MENSSPPSLVFALIFLLSLMTMTKRNCQSIASVLSFSTAVSYKIPHPLLALENPLVPCFFSKYANTQHARALSQFSISKLPQAPSLRNPLSTKTRGSGQNEDCSFSNDCSINQLSTFFLVENWAAELMPLLAGQTKFPNIVQIAVLQALPPKNHHSNVLKAPG